MRSRLVIAVAAIAALALAGCREDICARNSDCHVGYVCSDEGACVVPDHETPDASVGDATSAIDATTPDAPADSGTTDGG
jgi:hypothetical protein